MHWPKVKVNGNPIAAVTLLAATNV